MSTTPAKQQHQPKEPPRLLFKAINPVMRALLMSPLHRPMSGRLMVLHFTGRKSGNHYSVPVGYAQAGSTLYTGTERRWARNLQGGADIEVSFKGKRQKARADLVTGVDELVQAYREIYAVSPGYANALTRAGGVTFGPAGEVDRDVVERARNAGHVVIRTRLHEAEA